MPDLTTRLHREHLATGYTTSLDDEGAVKNQVDTDDTVLKLQIANGVLPSKAPYLLVLEDGTERFEVVKVTKVAPGPVATVTRAREGTAAVEHPALCTFTFGVTDQELADLVAGLTK